MPFDLGQILQTQAVVRAIDAIIKIANESLIDNIKTHMQSELNTACIALQEAKSSRHERVSILREARICFRKALTTEKHERLTVAYLGLAMCHFQLGEISIGHKTLRAFLEAQVAPTWSEIGKTWYLNRDNWGAVMIKFVPVPIPIANPLFILGSEHDKKNLVISRATKGKLSGRALELFRARERIESIKVDIVKYLEEQQRQKLQRQREDAYRRQWWLKLMTAVALVMLAGFVGVFAWQRWPAQPLDTFTDCRDCPEMVVIPAGSFTMGSPVNEPERYSNEGPQRQVTIGPFAMGKTEVTFGEWDACVAAGGCNGYKPPDQEWGRGSRPVVNVSWKDAKAYVSWLSQHTGKPYRLPSEAEWEYAARAGATTHYAFGDAITPKDANYAGSKLGKTTEVGSYPPNAWGLYDMRGNVWEWVEDVYGYQSTPTDGSEGENSSHYRVSRGGSWNSGPRDLRSADRNWYWPDDARDHDHGFRVARTLD